MRSLLYLVLAVALIAAGVGFGYYRWGRDGTSVNSAQGCFEVSDVKLRPAAHSGLLTCDIFPCIVGIVRNKCDQRFSTVWLTYNLYDHSGVQVGSTDAMISDLEPHGKARFGAEVGNVPKFARFKLIKAAVNVGP
jgi:hypothetical protein